MPSRPATLRTPLLDVGIDDCGARGGDVDGRATETGDGVDGRGAGGFESLGGMGSPPTARANVDR